MDRPWLSSYPAGVPATLDLDPHETLVSLFEAACRRFAARPAFANLGRTISFAELDALSARFAAFLAEELGLEPGERVAVMMPNLLQYPVAMFGVLRAGLVLVNVNPLYTARELGHQLADSGARAIVIVANSAATLEAVLAETAVEHVIVTEIGDLLGFPRRPLVNFVVRRVRRMVPRFRLPGAIPLRRALARGHERFQAPPLAGDALACLQYTGGTTGKAKGAMLSHANLVANVRQINTWFGGVVRPGEEIVLTPLPLYHVYAMTCNCLAYVDLGGLNVLITDPRDTAGFIAEMARWRFTAMTGVNTLYQSLVDHPDLEKVDFSSLKLASGGGMAVQAFTAQAWSQRTGTEILEGYGLSETSPVVTTNPPDLEAYNASIGLPLPGTDVSLRDNDEAVVPAGEAGELCVRGPQVMSGYWGDVDLSRDAFTQDGFLKTGDIAVMDERGFLRIVDRKKDMILVSAFNVYPNEIENIVTMHPDITEAAAVGVPDERTREAVKLFVVLRPGATLSADAVRDYCRENLAAYKVPKHVVFRDALPKSNVGKILRRELRETAS